MPVIEPNGVALPTIGREDQERCEELLQRWMVALNSYDAPGMKSVMRFPHVRLAENRLVIYQADDNPMDLFTRLRQQHGWHHSAWNEITLVQSSPTKAHYAVQYTHTARMARCSASVILSTYSPASTATGSSKAARASAPR